jgi:hypothetical protein
VTLDIVPTGAAWAAATRAFAVNTFHWGFLAQGGGMPERLIGGDPDFWLEFCCRKWARDFAALADALDEYKRAFRRPEVIAATCADYRAGATLDDEYDRADLVAGRKIACPTLAVMSGARARREPPEVWRQYAQDMHSLAVDCGHFIPEEAPDAIRARADPAAEVKPCRRHRLLRRGLPPRREQSARRDRDPPDQLQLARARGLHHHHLRRRRAHARDRDDRAAVGHEDEVAGAAEAARALEHRAPLRVRVLRPAEEVVERRPRLVSPERDRGGVAAAAPFALQHLRDRDPLAPERLAEPLRLGAARRVQVTFGLAVAELEPGRIADAGIGERVTDENDEAPGPQLRPEGFVGERRRRRSEREERRRAGDPLHVSPRTAPPSG